MTNREARALLSSCDHTQRERYSSTTRDLLTEPRWGKWEGVADYEDGPATQIDARDTALVLYVAGPTYAACVVVWCAVGMGALMVVGCVARMLGWM